MLPLSDVPRAKRTLHLVYLIDTSGSMSGTKISSVNHAMAESLQALQDSVRDLEEAEVLVRAVTFESSARWHIATPTPVAAVRWSPVSTGGSTQMGEALRLLAKEMTAERMGDQRGYAPVFCLMSDGQPTDDFRGGLQALLATPWGKRAARTAIAIGADADRDMLQEFIGNVELPVLEANNPQQLAAYIKFVSVQVSRSSMAPPSQGKNGHVSNTIVVQPVQPVGGEDVW